MNLESQVTSLELSKKLKELGVNQESLFYWVKNPYFDSDLFEITRFGEGYYHISESCSAFNASELLELLPKEWIRIEFHGKKYHCFYHYIEEERLRLEFGNTLQHSLAKMLIYLIENNLFEIK